MPSIFSRIVSGEIPCYKIAENERFLAFLDVFPLRKGHVLVIPKTEVDHIIDMNETDFKDLFGFAQELAKAIHKAFPEAKKIGISVIGLEVPHAHIHLIPINDVSDLNFAQPKLKLDAAEMQSIADSIKAFL
jgi:histidine triad (HIT) family protein